MTVLTETDRFACSKFRDIAEGIADYIRSLGCFDGRSDITVIVEDKGVIEKEIAQAMSFGGVCIIVGITGFDRRSQSGPLVTGTLKFELRIIERVAINRGHQGAMTVQEAAEHLARGLHWENVGGLDSPLLFQDFSREDSDEFNIVRMNFSGEASLGMKTNN